ncbi:hypothetical protein Tco_1339877, partial [Tanacetum coccineum]
EEGSDMSVQTPSHYESTDDEESDEETQGANLEGEKMDDEETNEEEEVNELYRDVNVNLKGRDTKMTYPNAQASQAIEDTHVIITTITPKVQQQSSSVSSCFISNMLNPNPNIGIDFILNQNTESTSLVDVPVTTTVEMPPSSTTTLPPPLFGDRVKALEDDFSVFKQTNQFAEVVSSIPGIDTYLVNKMNESVKTVVQLQSDKLRCEAQADNEDFINKSGENMKKIIKEKVKVHVKEQVFKILPKIEKFVNDQLKAKVLTRSSNEAKTTHVVVANLSEIELKKILIDKMENNKSIDKSIQQKTLYKALVDAYETDKDILDTYGDTVTFKRRRGDEDEDEEPSAGSNRGFKRRRAGKEPESTSAAKKKTSKSSGESKEGSKSYHTSTGKSAQAEEPIHADEDLEEPVHQEFDTRFTEDQPVDETTQHPDWFQKPTKPPTPDRDWNKTLPPKHGPVQPWISTLAQNEDPCESFNEMMDTPLDFSAFVLNWLKVDTLTPELLAGLTFELMKGSCKSLVELEYFLKEVCKVTTDQLDWNNLEGQQYPLSQVPIVYDKHAFWGISHWGRKRQQFYGYAINKESAHDVYSRNRIIRIKKLTIVKWHNYKHLESITIRKLTNLNIEECLALGVSLRMFTRSIVLRRRVEDLQLGIKSFVYQNKDKKNRLMLIDEIHKFINKTLNDVRSALDDTLKKIRMQYLPQTI